MSAPVLPRRGFLRGLTTLPLIGGSVAILGQPTVAAVPVTRDMAQLYETWLGWERIKVCEFLHGEEGLNEALHMYRVNDAAWRWHRRGYKFGMDHDVPLREAAARAPVILSAAGVPIGGGL